MAHHDDQLKTIQIRHGDMLDPECYDFTYNSPACTALCLNAEYVSTGDPEHLLCTQKTSIILTVSTHDII